MPWMIWEIRGVGRVSVFGVEYDIGSPALETVLQRPGRQITDIELLSSSSEIRFVLCVNAMRYTLAATNSVRIHGKDVWAVDVMTRSLLPESQAQATGALEYKKPVF